jgi:hypothetical protein
LTEKNKKNNADKYINKLKKDFEKRCWYSIGSPPPAASKNDVLKFLSVKSIVIAYYI